jgi:tetratricopeptide (TPR) repeat protein
MSNPASLAAHWSRIEQLFDALVELPEPDREAWLATQEPDPVIRAATLDLLRADAATGPLDAPLHPMAEEVLHGGAATVVGSVFGRYRLLELIGEGGTSTVWRAERLDAPFTQQVAVKCLKTGLHSPELRERFLREQRILARLEHRGIARLFDGGLTSDGVPFAVMECIDGEPVTHWCERHRADLATRLRLMLEICDAVDFAHRNLIVHRDIKPGNILVDAQGHARLLDFGIAKPLDDTAEPGTRTHFRALTPEYAAPEQFAGGPITTATDVYALGVVCYELLCGTRPVNTRRQGPLTQPSAAMARSAAPNHPLQPERRRLRGDLDTVVLKALRPEPDRRYASAREFAEDIKHFLEGRPVIAQRDTAWYRTRRFIGRHRVAVAASVALLASVVTGLVGVLWQAGAARAEAERAAMVREFIAATFRSAEPGAALNQRPDVETLLDNGARRALERFESRPELLIDMLSLIGGIERELGLIDRAEPLLTRAALIAEHYPDLPLSLRFQAQSEMARLEMARGRHDLAMPRLQALLAEPDADSLGPRRLAYLHRLYSACLRSMRQGEAALESNRLALELIDRSPDADPFERLYALEGFGTALHEFGHTDQAYEVLGTHLALAHSVYGSPHAALASALESMAGIELGRGRVIEAEALLREAEGMFDQVYARPHKTMGYVWNTLGQVQSIRGQHEQAVHSFARALANNVALYGQQHVQIGSTLNNIAGNLLARGLPDDALRVFEGVRIMQETVFGERLHPQQLTTLDGLATALERLQRDDEARATRATIARMEQSVYGGDTPATEPAEILPPQPAG